MSYAIHHYLVSLTRLFPRFAVTFSYMEAADTPGHVDLGGRLGLTYGSFAGLAVLFSYVFIPETRRKKLEDIDVQYNR